MGSGGCRGWQSGGCGAGGLQRPWVLRVRQAGLEPRDPARPTLPTVVLTQRQAGDRGRARLYCAHLVGAAGHVAQQAQCEATDTRHRRTQTGQPHPRLRHSSAAGRGDAQDRAGAQTDSRTKAAQCMWVRLWQKLGGGGVPKAEPNLRADSSKGPAPGRTVGRAWLAGPPPGLGGPSPSSHAPTGPLCPCPSLANNTVQCPW